MSKIADYFEQQEKEHAKEKEERDRQTVADYAKELNKSPAALLSQLRKAGVQKHSETDRMTDFDRQALLKFLQISQNVPLLEQKKITLLKRESEVDRLLRIVTAQEKGAEWECLNYIFESAFGGHQVESRLQAVANLIVAKAVIRGTLPPKKAGRPVDDSFDSSGEAICRAYWELRDRGASYVEASGQLAAEFHKDTRHIMRLVKQHKRKVGTTIEEREKEREWWSLMAKLSDGLSITQKRLLLLDSREPPELTEDDGLEYLDEQIMKIVKAKIADIN